NRGVLNPAFFIIFLGPVLLLLVSSLLQLREAINASFWLMLCATVAYLTGTVGVTVLGNVPLNNVLDPVMMNDLSVKELKRIRHSFESKWNSFHAVRTVFSIISFILLLIA